MRDGRNKDFRIGHYGCLRRLDRCYVSQNTRDILPLSFSGTLCFRWVSHREDNGEDR